MVGSPAAGDNAMQVIVSADWDLLAAIDAAYRAYVGKGKSSKGYRMSGLMVWANVVGRRRAVHDLEAQYKAHGSKKAVAEWLGVGPATLRKVEAHFQSVPEHQVLPAGVASHDLLDQLSYVSRLGSGANGEVWRARDALGRDVAVKFMLRQLGDEAAALDHARALGPISAHANVVAVHYCTYLTPPHGGGRRPGIVMEYVEGVTLDSLLSQGISLDDARTIGLGLTSAISHVHEHGMVHGDLHARNVLIRSDGEPVLIDLVNRSSVASYVAGSTEGGIQDDADALERILKEILAAAGRSPSTIASHSLVAEARVAFLYALDAASPRADSSRNYGQEFLAAWAEIERLLSTDDRRQTGQRLIPSVAVAVLLDRGKIEKRTAAEVDRLRSVRDQVVHGDPTILSQTDVAAVRRLLTQLRTVVAA
jgi:hypothetical protein